MATPSAHTSQAQQEAKRWANNDWAQRLARFGYAAKGLVYIIIGILAIQAAVGAGGKTTDQEGALQTIAQQPFGQIMLGIVGLGLISYSLWNLARAIFNLDDKDTDAKGIATRIWYAVIGISYGLLAWTALQIILNSASGSGNSTQDWTATVLSWPFGTFLVMLAGLAFIGAALFEWYKSYSVDFTKKLNLSELEAGARSAMIWLARFGLAARGVVFAILGYFIIQAALQHDPQEARGLGGALQSLTQQSYGPWLLLIVAAGLVAYGTYSMLKARYRRLGTAS